VRPVELALLAQLGLERVAQLDEHLHVERGVDEPGLRQRPGGPVGRRVALLQPQAQHVLDHGAEADALEAGEAPGQLGVEDAGRHQADLGEAGEVLARGVQHPLGVLQRCGQVAEVGAAERVDQRGAGAGAAQLHQVGALGVAVARGALGVDRDRPGAGGEARDDLLERCGARHDRGHAVTGRQQRLRLVLRERGPSGVAGRGLLVTRQGRRHKPRGYVDQRPVGPSARRSSPPRNGLGLSAPSWEPGPTERGGLRVTATDAASTTGPVTAPLDREALHRRSLRVLVLSQVLGGAGLGAGVTVGALLAEDVLGSTRLAGLPSALFTLGAAVAALAVGSVSERRGRRPGLAAGYAAGAVGGLGIVLAAVLDSPALLLLSLLVYGSGNATSLQARYAGGDLAPQERRGTAVSTILVATTLGAVAGPNLVAPTGRLAEQWGIPALAGPFLLAALAYAAAGVVLSLFLRPDPLLTARALAAQDAQLSSTPVPDSTTDWTAVRLGALAMVITQLVMVALMTMTPIFMRDHGHGLGATGLVIGLHVAAMFLPSPLTGRLADRYGSRPVIAAGGVALLAAGVVGAAAPVHSVAAIAVALVLLGLGWNLGLLGGTTLLAGAVPLDGRARVQGRVDVAVALAGATGGMGSGIVVASSSFATLSLAGGALALVTLAVVLRPAR
jgi:MFS family permease